MFLVVAAVSAAVVKYTSNPVTATVTVQSECNDGIDNNGNGLIDLGDPNCTNICNNENKAIINITECI